MTGIQLSGLASGLDTSSIISSLMTAAAEPQTLLNQQISTEQTTVSDLQNLNGLFQSLAQATDPYTGTTALTSYSVTSSQPAAATATADTTASPGSISFTVDQLATPQVDVTASMSAWPTNPPALTIVGANGTTTTVTPSSTSLDSVVSAINSANAGVTAVKVQSGADASGNPLYRLQLSSATTGAASAFTIYSGTPADVAAGTATDLSTQPGAAVVSTAQDAQLTLWPGTAAAQAVTSSSNTFNSVLPGVAITASSTTSTPVTMTVGQDVTTDAKTVQTLVSSVTSILTEITQGSASTTTTDANGNATVVFGSFTADSTVRDAASALTDAMTLDVNGVSPSTIGINLDENGNITFDQSTFEAAMANDPQGTTSLFNAIVSRVNTAATQASDPYTGTITGEITSDNENITAMQAKSADMQTLLDQQQATLQQEFDYMETTMSQIQSQGSYLSSYLSALGGSSSSSSSSSASSTSHS